ncbi:hypothetical protein DPM19_32480 [Actinomadura craniellae]|uniref:YcaO domain-containing protein n=1 Tax=Actinomadura craniellae TaxID=2231787 RepID=A0A365GYM0_9ACTN|nr:YcaO-like family protein [Actinomadura craniellae]RAY11023.1 hypothetical protein DPM19_32480 [Actinomadura craniellae]
MNPSSTTPRGTAVVQAGERQFSLAEARRLGRQAVAEAGLSARLWDLRDAWRCRLYRPDGSAPHNAMGNGKGPSDAAQVGALFEALEHCHSSATRLAADHLVLRSPDDLRDGPLADALTGLRQTPGTRLACRTHLSLTGSPPLDVPVFLQCPDYPGRTALRRQAGDTCDYTSATRYSTNSGTAIGATRAEALVHALAEAIERDALSLLVAATFLTAAPPPLRVIDPATLPPDLADLHRYAERRLAAPVHLIDMTTDLEVPAYCAHTPDHQGRPLHGTGASLSSAHAAHRALSELLQSAVLSDHLRATPRDLSHLRRYPRLLAAAGADFTPHLPDTGTTDFTPTTAPTTPRQHAEHLTARLTRHGHTPYARTLHTATNGVTTLSVIVPGLDRFFTVTYGNAVLPGPRARRLLTR